MALDVYLEIDGIKGESLDFEHPGWIECTSVQWEMSQPKSATASTGGGHSAERAELSDIGFQKLVDISSPLLMQSCVAGRTIARAKFEFFRADGQGERIKYFEVELTNVLIGRIAPSVYHGSVLAETIALKFSRVKWRYTQQKIIGGAGGNVVGGWDLATNRIS